MIKKICFITATRAEYGLLKPLMDLIKEDGAFYLQILVTGAHLSPEFGLTYQTILQDGFDINAKVEMLLSSDTSASIVKSMGLGMIGFADTFERLKPDAVVILGDRYEMLAAASAASVFKIPIIHLHGGEITEGAYDDAFRHAITKLAHLHFTSTEEHRARVIQMGEQPDHVYNVGAIGLDNILKLPLLSKSELEEDLGFKFHKYTYKVAFHPETLAEQSSADQFAILLEAIKEQEDSLFVFTKSNADTDGRVINQMIQDFVRKFPEKAVVFSSLGSLRFLSLLYYCDAIIGNSSSGIIEAPTLKIPTINIGQRQKGRTQAKSVINCAMEASALSEAFEKVKDPALRLSLKDLKNPYGDGHTADKIIEVLHSIDLDILSPKCFYNLKS